MGRGQSGLGHTFSRLPFTPKEQGKLKMANIHALRRLLDWLRPDQEKADEQKAKSTPLDPAVIQARAGDVDELAGLLPSERIDADGEDGR